MNTFERLKKELLDKYPPFKTLSLFSRLLADFQGCQYQWSVTEENEKGQFTQHAVIIKYKDKAYLRYFGVLANDNPMPILVKFGLVLVGIITWGGLLLRLLTK